jgi:hypothetical protein
MDILQDVIIVAGFTSVTLLWVASAAGAFHVLWDTFAKHLEALVKRVKR